MPEIDLPDPPLGDREVVLRGDLRAQKSNHASQAVAARAGFEPVAAPVAQRPECDHLPDLFFARLRGG